MSVSADNAAIALGRWSLLIACSSPQSEKRAAATTGSDSTLFITVFGSPAIISVVSNQTTIY